MVASAGAVAIVLEPVASAGMRDLEGAASDAPAAFAGAAFVVLRQAAV